MHSLDIQSLKWSKYLEISWFTRLCVIWLWRAFTISLWTTLSDSQLWSRPPPFDSSNTTDSSLTDGFPGSGLLPLPFIWVSESHSVMFDSLQPHGLYGPWNSPGQNTGVGCHSPSPGDLHNPEIEPRSPTLQVDSLPAKPQGKPKNAGVGSLSLLQQIFLTQESNQGLLHCRWILYQLSYQGSPEIYTIL